MQHLSESGQLTNTPKDIGMLIKEIERDLIEEEEQNIRTFLWNNFKGEVIRKK